MRAEPAHLGHAKMTKSKSKICFSAYFTISDVVIDLKNLIGFAIFFIAYLLFGRSLR